MQLHVLQSNSQLEYKLYRYPTSDIRLCYTSTSTAIRTGSLITAQIYAIS